MKYIIAIFMCLFLICSCDNHDVEFNEKEQTFYIYNLLHFSYTYDFFLRTKGTCREVDTICLKKRISKKFKAIESSSYKQEFRYNPSYIRLLPNTQYVIRHDGMGAKVNIIKYFYTDSSGNLHYKCDEKSSRNYKNLNYKDFCYILNSATLLEASECCGQNCQECDFFRARAGFLPCAG